LTFEAKGRADRPGPLPGELVPAKQAAICRFGTEFAVDEEASSAINLGHSMYLNMNMADFCRKSDRE
jgi:hypothetical protein